MYYIKNPETIPRERKYGCNKTVANWLIYKRGLPLLGKDGKIWYFAKTKELDCALEEFPLWLSVASKF